MRRMILLVYVFWARAAAADPTSLETETGILRVSSQYEAGIREVGTGMLLADPPRRPGATTRYFVLTCAHLTGGTSVEIAGQPLASMALGERRDALRDVDIIEIDPTKLRARPFARRIAPEGDMRDMKNLFFRDSERGSEIPELSLDELSVDDASLQRWASSGKGLVPMTPEAETAYALEPDWADAGKVLPGNEVAVRHNPEDFYRDWSTRKDFLNGTLVYNPLSKTISAPARIAPGMSCAPLIKKFRKSSHTLVLGLGTEFRVATAESTFNSSQLLLENLKAYKGGNPPPDFPAEWKSQSGLLYVDLGAGNAEVISSHPAGNGVAAASGNGVTLPPGNGVTVPPGNGVTVPPGRDGVGSLSTGAGPAGASACDPKKIEEQDPWARSKIKPGILWQGQEVLGFSMVFPYEKAPYPESQPFLIYPDREGIEFRLRHGKSAAQVKDIPLGAPLLSWLDQRYSAQALAANPIDLTRPRYRLLAPGENGLSPSMIERRKDSLHFELLGPGNDPISFDLNQSGGLIGGDSSPKEFKPLVEVRGKSGDVYEVDLTDLFYVQVANMEPEAVEQDLGQEVLRQDRSLLYNGKKNTNDQWLDMILSPYCGGCLRNAELTFRKKCSAEEFQPRFSEAVPEEVAPTCQEDGSERLQIKGLSAAVQAVRSFLEKSR